MFEIESVGARDQLTSGGVVDSTRSPISAQHDWSPVLLYEAIRRKRLFKI
jgi:hypothetical protein